MRTLVKIGSILIALTTIALIGELFFEAAQALTSSSWQEVQGTVVDTAGVVERSRYRYYLDLTYAYRVADRTYTGQRLCFLHQFFGCPIDLLRTTAQDYPRGASITVYYAPAWPEFAVIYRASETRALPTFVIALPIVLLGAAILIAPGYWIASGWWRSRSTRRKITPD